MTNKRSDVAINFRTLLNGIDAKLDKGKKSLIGLKDAAQKTDKPLKDMKATADKTGKSVEDLGKKGTVAGKKLNLSFKSLGKLAGLTAIFSTVTLGLRSATRAFIDFEQQMADISTLIAGDSTEAVGDLSDGILELTKRIPKDPKELGSAAYSILSAGITDTTLALETLEASSKLAVAGLGTVDQSTNLLTSTLNAFAGEGISASEAANSLFLAVANGKTTVAELSQGFGSVAGQVAATDIKFNDFISTVAALTTVGLPASQAYTQIRAALSGLTRETETSIDVFNRLGVKTFKELVKNTGGMTQAFQAIREEVGDNDAEMLKLVGSTEALNAIISISDVVGDSYATTLEQMSTNTEALNDAFEKQTKTLKSQIQLIKNGLNATFIQLGNEILPQITEVLADFTGGVEDSEEKIDLLTVAIKLLGAAFTGIFQTIVIAATLFKTGVISTLVAVEAGVKLVTGTIISLGTGIARTFEGLNTYFKSQGKSLGKSLEVVFNNPLESIKLGFVKTINFIIDKLNFLPGAVESVIGILPDKVKETLNLDNISLKIPKLEEPKALLNQFEEIEKETVKFKDAFNFDGVGDGFRYGLDEASKGFSDLEAQANDSVRVIERAFGNLEKSGQGLIDAFDPAKSQALKKQRQNTSERIALENELKDIQLDNEKEVSDARSEGSDKAKDDTKELSEMTDKELEDLGEKSVKVWEKYEESIEKAQNKIAGLKEKQADLIDSFKEDLRDADNDLIESEVETAKRLAEIYVESENRINELREELRNTDADGDIGTTIDNIEKRRKKEAEITAELEKRRAIEASGEITFGIEHLERELEAEQMKIAGLENQLEKRIELGKKMGEDTSEAERQLEIMEEIRELERERIDAGDGIVNTGSDVDAEIDAAREESEKTESQKLTDQLNREREVFEEKKRLLEALREGELVNVDEIQNYENLKLYEEGLAKMEAIESLKQVELDKIAEIEAAFIESIKVAEATELASILRRKGSYESLISKINQAIQAYQRLDSINASRANAEPPLPQIPVFHEGGKVDLPKNEGMALLQDKEFVVKASAVQKNLPLLEAINAGNSLAGIIASALPKNLPEKVSQISHTTTSQTSNVRNDNVNIYTNSIDNDEDLFDRFNNQRNRQF